MPTAASSPLPSLRANMLLPGVYAWVSTVAYPASTTASWVPRIFATLSVGALIAGAWFIRSRPILGRAFGVYAFVGFSVAAWVFMGEALQLLPTTPVRTAMGALGWLLFAFGWGYLRQRGNVPELNPRALPGEPLAPRAELSPVTSLVFATSLVGSLAILALAWQVQRPTHALLAHAVAGAAVVWLMSASARIATSLGESRTFPSSRRRLNAAARSLSGLILAFALGSVWVLLR